MSVSDAKYFVYHIIGLAKKYGWAYLAFRVGTKNGNKIYILASGADLS